MNQDQVKALLIELREPSEEFSVVFSGKSSKKVDGLYKPEEHEILIHNHNMKNDQALIYTAIHEYAHHLHVSESPVPVGSRAHSKEFWSIFHRLLQDAESRGLYANLCKTDQEFQDLTRELKEKYLAANGELMKEFGKKLLEVYSLCRAKGISFEDYVDRELGLHRSTAKTLMKVYKEDLDPKIGFDNMKTIVSIPKPELRQQAQEAFQQGESPDMVKDRIAQIQSGGVTESGEIRRPDPQVQLRQEKRRIERTIERMRLRLEEIDMRLQDSDE